MKNMLNGYEIESFNIMDDVFTIVVTDSNNNKLFYTNKPKTGIFYITSAKINNVEFTERENGFIKVGRGKTKKSDLEYIEKFKKDFYKILEDNNMFMDDLI